MPTSSIKKTLLINLAVFLGLLLLVELSFRVFVPSAKYWTIKEFRLTQPEPYSDSAYFSKEFVEESFDQPGGWITPPGTSIVLPNDYHGKYFNVTRNIRNTVGNSNAARRSIYLFGGSTLYDSEVPDEFTVASQLQQLVNQRGLGANVINLGVTTIHAGQQLERLKTINVNSGDIVVFYDGVNDVTQRIYFGHTNGWMTQEAQSAPAMVKAIRKLSKHSYFFRWLDRNFTTKRTYSFDATLVRNGIDAYYDAVDSANRYVTSRNAQFFHFLQPNLPTKKTMNPYEVTLTARQGDMTPPGIFEAFRLAYPKIVTKFSGLPYNHDLSHAFDDFQKSPYLDFCHVNEKGNQVIAQRIFETIFPQVRSPH